MSEKNITSRIVHKHDVESNWLLATNFVPKQGEIIIYDKDESYDYERFKIGDGVTLVSSLPFATDAVKVTVDDALSSASTNPVQNKVVNTAINNLNTLVGDTAVSDQINSALVNNQPDWNQNDETQPDYVKNRPFYTGDPVETVLVEESTVSFTENSGLYAAQFPSTFEATVGETYKVYWDGTAYECTCVLFEGTATIIGNLSIVGAGSDTSEPFLMSVFNGEPIIIYTADASASHTFSINGFITEVVKIDAKYLPDNPLHITGATIGQIAKIAAVDDMGKPTAWEADTQILFKPDGKSYLTFSSPSSFTLKVKNSTKNWDGTLEYFSSDKTWTTWEGTSTVSAVTNDGEYVIYLRGTGNTVLTGSKSNYGWTLTGSNIACVGNIENLLDYTTVESGGHPTMASYCYASMFLGCTSLTQAPALPATTLTDHCYMEMFYRCTSLTQAPALPATTLANYCYYNMFVYCTSLIQAPTLPATTLAGHCYTGMFQSCTSLIQAPALPATTLTDGCYGTMFSSCTSLTKAPALPATTLTDNCYMNMFSSCTSLIQVPALPATTLVGWCYDKMFNGCTSLKLSSTKTDEYTQEYRIPSSGNGTTATNALRNMFGSTGGTFTGTPKINTTYYLSTDNMIVRETDIATLNGYVGSMINNAVDAISPKMTTVSIPAANWTGNTAPYSQVITVNGVTANSKVDLQPTAAQILELQEADIMLMAENDNGTVTIYALGGIPTSDYAMQVLITEVKVV